MEIKLTERQTDILILLAQGLTYEEMSLRLHISKETVKYHASQLFMGMEANNAAHAVSIAYNRGILPAQERLF